MRVNQMIRIPQVRVVDEDGAQLGVMPTAQALAMAQERGYDLVEVAPMASPPVARFLDFGQYKYELTKREKEAKRKQRSITFKEVRLKPKIGIGDFDTKVRRAIEFLEEGDRIKVAVQFRGRELTHPEIGRALIEKFTDKIKDHGVVERAPLLEGKSMHITVASVHKPKSHDGPTAAPADGTAASDAVPAPVAEVRTTAASAPVTAPAAVVAPAAVPKAAAETAVPTAAAEAPVKAAPPAPAAPAAAAAAVVKKTTTTTAPAEKTTAAAAPKPRTRTKTAPNPVESPAPATSGE
ncbi:MAG TPA: translation initiation factor IF-3 [Candidatus Acidoferrum sp.]|nr:translation initiation factor IF-3 [Candidatus Acidoferrum sp.]